MDTAAPLAAANAPGVDGLLNRISAFVAAAKAASADGLTWAEFGQILLDLLRLVVTTLAGVSSMSGPDKKALAMEAVAELFDALATRAVPFFLLPVWVFVRPAARTLVLGLASSAIETLVKLLRV